MKNDLFTCMKSISTDDGVSLAIFATKCADKLWRSQGLLIKPTVLIEVILDTYATCDFHLKEQSKES